MVVPFKEGDIIRHFKRDLISNEDKEKNLYLYRVVAIAKHTETQEMMLVYQALYYPFDTYTRPLLMAMEPTPKERYPEEQRCLLQEHRLEAYFEE